MFLFFPPSKDDIYDGMLDPEWLGRVDPRFRVLREIEMANDMVPFSSFGVLREDGRLIRDDSYPNLRGPQIDPHPYNLERPCTCLLPRGWSGVQGWKGKYCFELWVGASECCVDHRLLTFLARGGKGLILEHRGWHTGMDSTEKQTYDGPLPPNWERRYVSGPQGPGFNSWTRRAAENGRYVDHFNNSMEGRIKKVWDHIEEVNPKVIFGNCKVGISRSTGGTSSLMIGVCGGIDAENCHLGRLMMEFMLSVRRAADMANTIEDVIGNDKHKHGKRNDNHRHGKRGKENERKRRPSPEGEKHFRVYRWLDGIFDFVREAAEKANFLMPEHDLPEVVSEETWKQLILKRMGMSEPGSKKSGRKKRTSIEEGALDTQTRRTNPAGKATEFAEEEVLENRKDIWLSNFKRLNKKMKLLLVERKKHKEVSASSKGAGGSASSSRGNSDVVEVEDESESIGSEEEEQKNLQEKSRELREKAVGRYGNLADDEGELDQAISDHDAEEMVQDLLWKDLMGEDGLCQGEDEEALFLRRFRRQGGEYRRHIDAISRRDRYWFDISFGVDCISKQYRHRIDTSASILSSQVDLPADRGTLPQRGRQR